jgi:spectinomycin phosphotransferase
MLKEPEVHHETIIARVQDAYGLRIIQVAFLPLGADRHTAVYRGVAEDGTPYFLKLRLGAFDETSVSLPKFLRDHGLMQVVAPLETREGNLWTSLDRHTLILYPFVEGRDVYEVELSDRHWIELGQALKQLHTAVLPRSLSRRIHQETYSPDWREQVRTYLRLTEGGEPADPVAAELVAFLKANLGAIVDLVARAERLALQLHTRSRERVLCHSDIHAGNLLIDAEGSLYIVDWDAPILAPKERDLMFVGSGMAGDGHSAAEEEALFYRGYGPTQADAIAMAYYRYERIVEDIAVFCDRIVSMHEGKAEREQCLRYVMSNFLPGGTLELALRSDSTARNP